MRQAPDPDTPCQHDPERWLTTQEIARTLNLSVSTVQHLIRAGTLPAYKFGREYRVNPEDFQQFLTAHRLTPEPPTSPR